MTNSYNSNNLQSKNQPRIPIFKMEIQKIDLPELKTNLKAFSFTKKR